MAISIERLRPAVDDDIIGLNEIYNHYVRTSHATFDLDPTGIDWRREWLSNHSGGPYRAFIAVGGRQIVGFAASSRHRPKAAYDTPPRRACTSHVGEGPGYLLLCDPDEVVEVECVDSHGLVKADRGELRTVRAERE